ncbi:MAG: type IV secretion system protein [Treponema sp.]|nr:type IV secretion system protein [Treponema sp.]
MFSNINGTWLDGAFFNVLGYVDNMHLFYMKQVRILAMICFALSLGISCIKMAMGAMEINKALTQTFMAVITYFVMIFLFPHIMIQMQKIISELAHGSVFSQGFSVNFDSKYGRGEDFYNYLDEIGSDKNGNTVWAIKESNGNAPKALDLQVTNKETGIISLNKIFQMIITTFKALWKSINIANLKDFFRHFPDILLVFVICLAYLWALTTAIVNYAMTVVEYAFLYGMGALFIPLMLWDGSKHAFEKLCGSIFNIGIKLLVVQTTLYLVVMTNVDILKNMFIISSGQVDFLQGLEFYLSIIFMVAFIKLFVNQAPAIAEFLCGGQPRIGFREFTQAAKSTAAAGMAAAGIGGTIVKGAATTGAAIGGAVGAAGSSAGAASSAARAQGGSAGAGFMAGLASFGKSIGQSAKQGGANILDKGIDAVANAPQAIKNTGKLMGFGIDPSAPLSMESMGLGSRKPANNGGGAANNGGGNFMLAGGSNGHGSSWFLASGESGMGGNKNQSTGGERQMQSNNISDRVQGMGALYNEKRNQGGEYSGLSGRFKALKSSIGDFHAANKQAAPGNAPSKEGGAV